MRWPRSRRRSSEQEGERRFLLQTVQPFLNGLMDGAVSTLAPLFAVAFATHSPITAFLIGLATATGSGISMAFAEALSDSGKETGRGNPIRRGLVVGLATFLGGVFHTFPFLIGSLAAALTLAYIVVGLELLAIAVIRWQFLHIPLWRSVIETSLAGALVFGAAALFGNA